MARVLVLLFCRPRGKLPCPVRVAHSRLPTFLGLGVSVCGEVCQECGVPRGWLPSGKGGSGGGRGGWSLKDD